MQANLNSTPRRIFAAAMSIVLSASFCMAAPASASADDDAVVADWLDAASNAFNNPGYQAFSYAYPNDAEASAASSEDAAASAASDLPSKLDLRDRGVVTPVKFQNPWGTCWGFAAVAASETSILSEGGKTYQETGMDLSERQLAWFTFSQTTEEQVGAAQAGEGFHNTSKNPNFGLDAGGFKTYASSIFASGTGPMSEAAIPYSNDERIKMCRVVAPDKDHPEETSVTFQYINDEQIEQLERDGAKVEQLQWAGNYMKPIDATHFEPVYTTWKVSDSLRNQSVIELEHGYILPSTRKFDSVGDFQGVDWQAVEAIKRQMNDYGRGVIVSFNSSSEYRNGGLEPNSPCSHYTWELSGTNHVVTIVGWDDDYSAKNFGDTTEHMPEGNGAWLVKNSWGSDTEDFPNKNSWGSADADGKQTGYFWLSYYDKSADGFESFDYDLNTYGDQDEYIIDQYDYLAQRDVIVRDYDQKVSTANIFTADEDRAVRTLSCETYKPNTTVIYDVYLLDDDAQDPTDADDPVISQQITYEYGGYHRTTLDESDWIAMREGQRYSVVVTQKCNDDGKYYAGVGYNTTKPTEKEIEANRNAKKEVLEQDMYKEYYNELLAKYIDEGMDQTAAEKKADADAKAKVASPEAQATINEKVEEEMDTILNCYFVSKVNAGESWTTAPQQSGDDSGDGQDAKGATFAADGADGAGQSSSDAEWTDWLGVRDAMQREYDSWAIDNLSIKAFAEIRDWASIESLDELKAKIAEAEAVLDATWISDDGSDVPSDETWMTQAEHDALEAAIAAAKEQLELAGDDYARTLIGTTPGQQTVDDAIASLAWDAKQGTSAAGGTGGSGAASKGKLAATGDDAAGIFGAALAVATCGAVALGITRRRLSRRL